jgi:hypothetical protein
MVPPVPTRCRSSRANSSDDATENSRWGEYHLPNSPGGGLAKKTILNLEMFHELPIRGVANGFLRQRGLKAEHLIDQSQLSLVARELVTVLSDITRCVGIHEPSPSAATKLRFVFMRATVFST